MVTAETIRLAKILWDYHHMHQEIQKADCILVLCSHDTRVAERGATLFLDGWSPLLVFSGGLGRLTKGSWKMPEADLFAQIAIDMGVPRSAILIENRSTNTGENIVFTKALLEQKNIHPNSFLLVQKPYRKEEATQPLKISGQANRLELLHLN